MTTLLMIVVWLVLVGWTIRAAQWAFRPLVTPAIQHRHRQIIHSAARAAGHYVARRVIEKSAIRPRPVRETHRQTIERLMMSNDPVRRN